MAIWSSGLFEPYLIFSIVLSKAFRYCRSISVLLDDPLDGSMNSDPYGFPLLVRIRYLATKYGANLTAFSATRNNQRRRRLGLSSYRILRAAIRSSPGSTSRRLALNFVARCACLFIRHSILFSTMPPRGRCNDDWLLPANLVVSITSARHYSPLAFVAPLLDPLSSYLQTRRQ